MKTIALVCALVLTSLATSFNARAEEGEKSQTLRCSGSYFVYSFTMQGTVVGNKVRSPVAVAIVDGSGQTHEMQLAVATSDVREGQYVHMTGKSADGSGVLAANFDGSQYGGTLDANTKYGNADVDVTCTLGAQLDGSL